MKPVVLASTSIFRKELLSRLVSKFDVIAPLTDESAVKARTDLSAEQKAVELAKLKGNSVLDKVPKGHIVVASDQIGELGSKFLGKPVTVEKALQQLAMLSGKTHTLYTSLFVGTSQNYFLGCVQAKLTMRTLSPEDIRTYVEKDSPLNCAGGYKIEQGGIGLFENIECSDWNAIVGLPLMMLQDRLISARA